ncbi:MAG: 3-dehydroquinate synthase [Bacteroidetes bacterium]|nr:3-dehydroquinate synthase [Bacteroidota bacterium]
MTLFIQSMQYSLSFPSGEVNYIFSNATEALTAITAKDSCILITDANVAALYPPFFEGYKTLIVSAGEANKTWESIKIVAEKLLEYEAHRNTLLIGVGGGVITDLTGFIASTYMRGVAFGYIPTTLLGMADAAIGGKNGINLGLHKNILGTIQQPKFLLYDVAFLSTLPDEEWSNGFAEVIKYACLFDEALYQELSQHNIHFYKHNDQDLERLIAKCADWKNKTVLADEKEQNGRKLLNFGHTAGHAIETLYNLPHGQAVALGMIIACTVSEKACGLNSAVKENLKALLLQYNLPVQLLINPGRVMEILIMDKKRNQDSIDFIVLNKVGEAEIKSLSFDIIQQALVSFAHASSN